MVPFLYTARDHHSVRTAEEYRLAQMAWLARRAAAGGRAVVHDSPGALAARIDANTWLVDCECGAGNATDPAWGVAYCFGCGAVHRTIVFPDPSVRAAIEATLIARATPFDRSWRPGEPVAALAEENRSIGAAVPGDVEDEVG